MRIEPVASTINSYDFWTFFKLYFVLAGSLRVTVCSGCGICNDESLEKIRHFQSLSFEWVLPASPQYNVMDAGVRSEFHLELRSPSDLPCGVAEQLWDTAILSCIVICTELLIMVILGRPQP